MVLLPFAVDLTQHFTYAESYHTWIFWSDFCHLAPYFQHSPIGHVLLQLNNSFQQVLITAGNQSALMSWGAGEINKAGREPEPQE